jgi:hypothetical protein
MPNGTPGTAWQQQALPMILPEELFEPRAAYTTKTVALDREVFDLQHQEENIGFVAVAVAADFMLLSPFCASLLLRGD